MTPKQEMELLLEEGGRQSSRQEMELLFKEADRQSTGDTCPTCGQGKDHAGWMLCLDERLELRKEDMTDAKNFGNNGNQGAQVLTPENLGPPGDGAKPPGAQTDRTKEPAPKKKVRQTKKGLAASMPSSRRNVPTAKPGMSKSAQSLLRRPVYIEFTLLVISFGLAALRSIGFGLRSVLQFFVGGVLKTGRGILALLGLLAQGVAEVGRGILRLLALLVRSIVAAGKGILRLLSLLVRGVVAAGKGILRLLSLLMRGVVAAGKGILRLLQLLVSAVVQAGKRIVALFKLMVRGVTIAGRQVARLLVWMAKPVSWVLGMVVLGAIKARKRVHALLELLVEAAGRLVPTRQVAPKAIGLITSEGGPQVTNQVSSEATILITSGLDQGRSFQVGAQPVTIGSGENCGIRLPAAPGFAAEHARLWWRDGQRMLHHLAPDQATIVAGKQIIWTSLQDGDEASIGPYSLRITTEPACVSS